MDFAARFSAPHGYLVDRISDKSSIECILLFGAIWYLASYSLDLEAPFKSHCKYIFILKEINEY